MQRRHWRSDFHQCTEASQNECPYMRTTCFLDRNWGRPLLPGPLLGNHSFASREEAIANRGMKLAEIAGGQGLPERVPFPEGGQGSPAGRRGPTPGICCSVQTLLEFRKALSRTQPQDTRSRAAPRPGAVTCAWGSTRLPFPSAPARPERAFVGPQCNPAGRGETAPAGHPGDRRGQDRERVTASHLLQSPRKD